MNANVRAYLTEAIGTFILVLLSAGAVCANGIPALSDKAGYGVIGIALVAGLASAATLASTLKTAGGFLNPAITVTLWVFQRLDNNKAIGLIVAQVIGAAFGGLAVRGLFFTNERVLAATRMGTPHINRTAYDLSDV